MFIDACKLPISTLIDVSRRWGKFSLRHPGYWQVTTVVQSRFSEMINGDHSSIHGGHSEMTPWRPTHETKTLSLLFLMVAYMKYLLAKQINNLLMPLISGQSPSRGLFDIGVIIFISLIDWNRLRNVSTVWALGHWVACKIASSCNKVPMYCACV